MIRSYVPAGASLTQTEGVLDGALWLDLSKPTEGERAEISELLGRPLPSLEDQKEIEHSSRLYQEDGVAYLTALLSVKTISGEVVTAPVTFILTAERLVTIRHHPHGAFRAFRTHSERGSLGVGTAARILVGLLEAVVDRMADVTEQIGREIEVMTRRAFHGAPNGRPMVHTAALRSIGRQDSEVMLLRESLLSVERLLGYLQTVLTGEKKGAHRRALKSCQRDVRTIAEQANFLSQKTALLLDATLGMIDIEQNEIGKIFSIVATVFLPPTLIASFWGMNFERMPLLQSGVGFWATVAVMAASAAVTLVWFKRKGWL